MLEVSLAETWILFFFGGLPVCRYCIAVCTGQKRKRRDDAFNVLYTNTESEMQAQQGRLGGTGIGTRTKPGFSIFSTIPMS